MYSSIDVSSRQYRKGPGNNGSSKSRIKTVILDDHLECNHINIIIIKNTFKL